MEVIIIIIVIILWFLLCFVVANAWKQVGLSYTIGFWNSFLFSPLIGILLGLLLVCGKNKNEVVTETEKVASEIYCPYCGKHTKTKTQICDKCGKNLSKVFEESEYVCSVCKHSIPEDALYCGSCGEKIE